MNKNLHTYKSFLKLTESNEFDNLDRISQNVLIEIKELIDVYPTLANADDIEDYPTIKKPGQFYEVCKFCGKDIISISTSKEHFDNCEWVYNFKKLETLQIQLSEDVLKSLDMYLDELED